ncbi:MAG: DUF4301 family protein [Bacteroidales bacterium]|nr:DUF4301 family protein [Candidatus Cryptobacteroides aphodequi]
MTQKEQIARFRKGFPELDIVRAATPGDGITVMDEDELAEALAYGESASVEGRCKFVPASGAASRMFKDIFARKSDAIEKLAAGIEDFAFYSPEVFGSAPYDPDKTASRLLDADGLAYGDKPKGVLRFHRYADETRTPVAEHLVEAAYYMKDADGLASVHFTISPEHRELFEKAVEEVRTAYEERYGVKYDITFSCQDKATDTIAVTPDNEPFLKDDGTILTRPAGHGALIYNLNALPQELISIKNIDNVAHERLLDTTAKYKSALIGRALMLRDMVRAYLEGMDMFESTKPYTIYPELPGGYGPLKYDPYASDEGQALCQEIETFLREEFGIEMPLARDCAKRAEALRAKLNRPLRVCGMVRNQGEAGGGPFIIREKDGSTSLQILESVQISDPALMKQSTHFNPVDIVCCTLDYKGRKFNLPDHVDPETGFISSKSWQGRELKALELPGLWNGAMSDWLTSFVEVPLDTFNPVKVVLDLLKPAHRGA